MNELVNNVTDLAEAYLRRKEQGINKVDIDDVVDDLLRLLKQVKVASIVQPK